MDKDFFDNAVVQVVIVIIVATLLQILSHRALAPVIRKLIWPHRYETKADEHKREDTLITVSRTFVAFLIWIVTFFVVLDTAGVNLAALATGAGLFGVVIGFGAQSTIKDILAGLFILMENQYRVGDIVTLSGGTTGLGVSGVVEEITLRITKLRDLDGTLNVVRNGEASIITNRTFKYSSVIVDVNVGFDADIDKVEKIMNQVGLDVAGDDKWKKATVETIQFLRIDKFEMSFAVARAVGRVQPATQWDIAGDYRRRLLKAFKEAGITVAVPQRLVHQAGPRGK